MIGESNQPQKPHIFYDVICGIYGRRGDNRGWDGWMASLTQWTWVWANFRRQWRTRKPDVLQSMGLPSRTWLSDWTTTKNLKCESRSVVSDSLQPHGLYSPWNSPGQNTGVGSLSLLQGNFPTQGSNLGLPHCRRILYQLSHKGSPREESRLL